jgi:hypothetical protein
MPVTPSPSKACLIPGYPKPELLRGEDLPHHELVTDDLFLDLGLYREGLFLLGPDVIGLRCGVQHEPSELIPLVQELIPQGVDVAQIAGLDGPQLLYLFGRQLKVVGEPTRRTTVSMPHFPLTGPLGPCEGYLKDKQKYR